MVERERVIMRDVKDWEVSVLNPPEGWISDVPFHFQLGKSVYNGTRYRSVESIVVL